MWSCHGGWPQGIGAQEQSMFYREMARSGALAWIVAAGTLAAACSTGFAQPRRPGQQPKEPVQPAQPQQPATPPPDMTPVPVPAPPVAPAPTVPMPAPNQPGTRPVPQPTPGTPAATIPGQPTAVQPSAVPKQTQPSFLDTVITQGRSRNWTLKVQVHLAAYQTDPGKLGRPGHKELQVIPLTFDTAAVVFPVPYGSAGHITDTDSVTGTLLFDDKPVDTEIDFADNYASGTRLARWEMLNREGRELDLKLVIPMTTWETVFDEELAGRATWPAAGVWPGEAASTLISTQGSRVDPVDFMSPTIAAKLAEWTGGNDPKKLKPVALAKFLAAKVMEATQPSGLGLVNARNGEVEGFDLQTASATLSKGRGSEHDIACLMCAVYRAAGLPARTVIGYDIKESKGEDSGYLKDKGSAKIRSWVEFYLFDESANKGIWVPVDIVRARKSSSRAPALDRPWKFFGTNDELDDVMPIAFQYHPPTTVVAHGSVAFWGWLTTPRLQQGASQWIQFQSMSTPNRGKPKTRREG